MNLITEFRGFDGLLADFDNEGGTEAVIRGNRMEIIGNGRVIATARLEVHGTTGYWRLSKGKRGKEIGIATEVRFSI